MRARREGDENAVKAKSSRSGRERRKGARASGRPRAQSPSSLRATGRSSVRERLTKSERTGTDRDCFMSMRPCSGDLLVTWCRTRCHGTDDASPLKLTRRHEREEEVEGWRVSGRMRLTEDERRVGRRVEFLGAGGGEGQRKLERRRRRRGSVDAPRHRGAGEDGRSSRGARA